MMAIIAGVAAVLAGIGLAEALIVARLVTAFARRRTATPFDRPPVTVLKPLHGDEPLLEEALTSLCRQDYPEFQVVFGVQDPADPAVAVVRKLQTRFPDLDIMLVVDETLHGRNRKVGNLINMMPATRNDILVVADADIHVRSDYLDRLVAALQQQGVGLVTTIYAGLPFVGSAAPSRRTSTLPARLGATNITHGFLPGAIMARALGRQDCLGATMCLRRHHLESIGGFHALVDHLADDNVLGRRIAAIGLTVALADTLSLTTVSETTFRQLFRHELRWARTIRALEPAGFAASVLQFPLAWALLTILLTAGAPWAVALFFIAWMVRAFSGFAVDRALTPLWGAGHHGSRELGALVFSCPVWLLPFRDVFSVAVMLASYGGRQVDWRGYGLHADTPPPPLKQPVTLRSVEEIQTR